MNLRHPKHRQSPLWLIFIESPCRNWPHHSPSFLSHFVTSYGFLLRVYSPLYLWRTWIKFRDALNFSTGMIFVIMSAGFFFVLIFTKSITLSYTTQLAYLVIPHINVLHPLMIPVILNKMNITLIVTVNLNWILFDAESLDWSTQSQGFLRCLNRNHVFCLCCWRSHRVLQFCLPTDEALSCEYISRRRS